jgi:hypothetical protein
MTDHADALYSDFSVMRKNRCTTFIAGANGCRRLYTIKIAEASGNGRRGTAILNRWHKKSPADFGGAFLKLCGGLEVAT